MCETLRVEGVLVEALERVERAAIDEAHQCEVVNCRDRRAQPEAAAALARRNARGRASADTVTAAMTDLFAEGVRWEISDDFVEILGSRVPAGKILFEEEDRVSICAV
jgi:hypothetical protein